MTIDRLRAHWGITRMPFAMDLAPSMLHTHRSHAEASTRNTWCIDERVMGVVTGEVGAGKTVEVRGTLAGIDASRHTVTYLGNPTVGYAAGTRASSRHSEGSHAFTGPPSAPRSKTPWPPKSTSGAAGSCSSWTRPTSSTPSSSKAFGCSRVPSWTRTHPSPACWSASRPCAGGSVSVPSPPSCQQVALRYAMTGMEAAETADYVVHHLKIAGRSDTLFSDDALALIHQLSWGLPRAVNNLAVQSLVAVFAESKPIVDESTARAAVTEVMAE